MESRRSRECVGEMREPEKEEPSRGFEMDILVAMVGIWPTRWGAVQVAYARCDLDALLYAICGATPRGMEGRGHVCKHQAVAQASISKRRRIRNVAGMVV